MGAVNFTRCRIEPDEAEKSKEATMAGPALAYAYRYPHASTLEGTPTFANLRLATWSARGSPHPHFFEGRLRRPGRAADLLRGLVEVVQSQFYLPPAMMARIMAQADPVVTGSGDLLPAGWTQAHSATFAPFVPAYRSGLANRGDRSFGPDELEEGIALVHLVLGSREYPADRRGRCCATAGDTHARRRLDRPACLRRTIPRVVQAPICHAHRGSHHGAASLGS